eukprot:1994153-Rhodomonas_salina.1
MLRIRSDDRVCVVEGARDPDLVELVPVHEVVEHEPLLLLACGRVDLDHVQQTRRAIAPQLRVAEPVWVRKVAPQRLRVLHLAFQRLLAACFVLLPPEDQERLQPAPPETRRHRVCELHPAGLHLDILPDRPDRPPRKARRLLEHARDVRNIALELGQRIPAAANAPFHLPHVLSGCSALCLTAINAALRSFGGLHVRLVLLRQPLDLSACERHARFELVELSLERGDVALGRALLPVLLCAVRAALLCGAALR